MANYLQPSCGAGVLLVFTSMLCWLCEFNWLLFGFCQNIPPAYTRLSFGQLTATSLHSHWWCSNLALQKSFAGDLKVLLFVENQTLKPARNRTCSLLPFYSLNAQCTQSNDKQTYTGFNPFSWLLSTCFFYLLHVFFVCFSLVLDRPFTLEHFSAVFFW